MKISHKISPCTLFIGQPLKKSAYLTVICKTRNHHILEFIGSAVRNIAVSYHNKHLALLEHHVETEHVGVYMSEFIIADKAVDIMLSYVNKNSVLHKAELAWSCLGWVAVPKVVTYA